MNRYQQLGQFNPRCQGGQFNVKEKIPGAVPETRVVFTATIRYEAVLAVIGIRGFKWTIN